MDYRLVKSISENNDIIFDFVGFDNWEDFIDLMDIISSVIKPDEINYKGITDMNGYFKKNGIVMEIEYTSMIGIYLVYKGQNKKETLEFMESWVRVIFDNLLKRKKS